MQQQSLRATVGIPGAVLLGLGSMVGSGIFVGIAVAAEVSGPSVLMAIVIAGLLALCNGLSSAQLATNHPVSGGTYEYGYHYLNPFVGFSAGWLFMAAKSASAATAALGCAGYLVLIIGGESAWVVPLAAFLVVAVTIVVLGGLRRTVRVNGVMVAITVLGLMILVACAMPFFDGDNFVPWTQTDGSRSFWMVVLDASALLFVAYTGYGRVATLGEEIHDSKRTIPWAIFATIGVTMLLYLLVTAAAVGAVGSSGLVAGDSQFAPLAQVADRVTSWGGGWVLTVAAATAMLGVLLNLVLGLSRVVVAMGRRGDVPRALAKLDAKQRTPLYAVVLVAFIVGALVLMGDIRFTWSFSAFTVLVYYAITNLAALRLSSSQRQFPRWVAVVGLGGCLGLTPWLDPAVLVVGGLVMACGWVWFVGARLVGRRQGA